MTATVTNLSAQVAAQVCTTIIFSRVSNGYKLEQLAPPLGGLVAWGESPQGAWL